MSDSDDDYIASDNEATGLAPRDEAPKAKAWEKLGRTWDDVGETADGRIEASLQSRHDFDLRTRSLQNTAPVQRGIIRHLIIVIDLSFAMLDRDIKPTRFLATLKFVTEFVGEFFEENPISQLGILGLRDGLATVVSGLGGNPAEHVEKLRALRAEEPQGNPSLQNGLELSRALLYHTPSHGTREVLVLYGALLTSDPGDIHRTIDDLVKDRIRVSMIGLAAQVYICAELCAKTNAGSTQHYSVAENEEHYRSLVMKLTTPPANQRETQAVPSLLKMGFPSWTAGGGKTMSFCTCHNKLHAGGYYCTRCSSKVCSLPVDCPICNLTLVLSTHLARSYHHLFPLLGWETVSWADASSSVACFACLEPFPVPPPADASSTENHNTNEKERDGGGGMVSESGRYKCPVCGMHFCVECDAFAHGVVHNCAGCMSLPGP